MIRLFCFIAVFGSALSIFFSADTTKYSSIRIGDQTWMKENLDVGFYLNGDTIPQVQDPELWSNLTSGAWCYVDENKKKYGKVYNWYAVNDPREIAPDGWEIPSIDQWEQMVNFLGGYDKAAKTMKSKYGWKSSGNGTNSSRLNCSPGAGRSSTGIVFGTIGGNVGYWSSSDVNKTTSARSINLDFYSSKVYTYRINKKNGFYVRCVKK